MTSPEFSPEVSPESSPESLGPLGFLGPLKVRYYQKEDWRAVDSPKKQTKKFVLFVVKSKKANNTN